MSEKIKLKIDGYEVEVEKGATILEAAKKAGVNIPTLCYHEDLDPSAACGICVVEFENKGGYQRSCCTPAEEGMEVITNSKTLRKRRKMIVELTLSNHHVDCPSCAADGKCELQELANHFGVETEAMPSVLEDKEKDKSSVAIERDPEKCILCGRCVEVCENIQTVNAIEITDRGFEANIDTPFGYGIGESPCINCGQCIVYCPTGALKEVDHLEKVWDAILDENKHVVVQEAPAIRATLGEEFGMEIGNVTVGKMYAALKRIGFDAIFDTNFSADLTIMEEGTEVVGRIKEGKDLPVITSCSPGWIKFMEEYYPELAKNVSTAKSPQQMMGVLTKTYYAEKEGLDPKDIVSVSIMPCTAKKFEAQRPEMSDSGYQDVDYVLTTREFVRMIKEARLDFKNLEPQEPYHALADYTGAATIFGATGGVMEAAIRSAYYLLTDEDMDSLDVTPVRGMEGVKEAELEIAGSKLKVAVAHGLGNARKILDKVKKQLEENGESEYAFVEIMACPGGCVGGGGQPYHSSIAMRARRGEGLYKEDSELPERASHHNQAILNLYEDFLGEPGSEKAHHLLHTNYFKRSVLTGKSIAKATGAHEKHLEKAAE
ncbi:MAG: 2Fe-2S iron-sulfur cluster binding domain-containing protein [Candidatus Mcinerneyibacterium aminivorans]|uniref:2Fe-2S iron-sulfur cluster binding domain-containing protein n=1 Tax=Candidatus Mcinerneyibacterium aminivorans TaxID=2703815 RepID=A0A5D0MAY5_9BACT|nr:MAG: 2Fe-2S iron-sulfur cluster binding domain-containing protein [Candidatus Mcinerneyibacterium aminivorans]